MSELRREIFTALGWTSVCGGKQSHRHGDLDCCGINPASGKREICPVVDTDIGVFFKFFLPWCKSAGVGWAMSGRDNNSVGITLVSLNGSDKIRLSGEGNNIAEAGCRAWLAALKERNRG